MPHCSCFISPVATHSPPAPLLPCCHAPTSENFVHFGLMLFVQMWTYKCKPPRSAKRHIFVTSLFQAVMCPWAPYVKYDCCFTEPCVRDTYPKGQLTSEWHTEATRKLPQSMQQHVKTYININKHQYTAIFPKNGRFFENKCINVFIFRLTSE